MRAWRHIVLVLAGLGLTGCGYWSRVDVESYAAEADARPPTRPDDIVVIAGDIAERRYEVLGDIAVTVNKTLLIEADPTPAMVDARLREEAAKLGADAVILVRYGAPGVTVRSWGSLEGKGRAVAFR